jgi:hypothetical protein
VLREGLVRALLTSPSDPQDFSGMGSQAWGEFIRLSDGWGALPRLSERIPRNSSQFSLSSVEAISRQLTDGYVRSMLEARAGLAVLHSFEDANIPVVAFKGLVSLARLYSDPKQRVIVDVDLLINEEDLARSVEALERLGFTPEVSASEADYLDFVQRSPGFGGNEELSFHNERGNTIDLHWRLGAGFDSATLINSSGRATFMGTEFPTVSDVDGLLLCVHHSLRNHFSPDKIMRDLMDLEHWCRLVQQAGSFDTVVFEATKNGLHVPLLALTYILRSFDKDGAGAEIATALEFDLSMDHRAASATLEQLFHTQVREGQFERDTLFLLRPRELKQLFAGLLLGGRRHLALSRSMDAAHAGNPVSSWQRIADIGRSVLKLRPRHIRMLRTLAHAKDRFERTGRAG